MTRQRPRLLICGWIGATNLGDELIAMSVADLVASEGGEPTLVTIDPDKTMSTGYDTVRHRGPIDTISLARAARRHHGLVFGGGGLIQDETGPFNLPFHLSRVAAGRLARLPWICLALGVGDVRRRSGRLIVRLAMRNSIDCTVRDRGSAQRLAALTGLEPRLGIDPVVGSDPVDVAPEPVLVVSLRPPNRPDQIRTDRAGVDDAFVAQWARSIDAIALPRDLAVRFVAWDPHHDAPVHAAVAEQLRSPSTLEEPASTEVIQRVGASQLVVTMRYHGAVAATLTNRPAVVVDYSPKMGDLVDEAAGGLELVSLDAPEASIVSAARHVSTAGVVHSLDDRLKRVEVNREAVNRLIAAARFKQNG